MDGLIDGWMEGRGQAALWWALPEQKDDAPRLPQVRPLQQGRVSERAARTVATCVAAPAAAAAAVAELGRLELVVELGHSASDLRGHDDARVRACVCAIVRFSTATLEFKRCFARA